MKALRQDIAVLDDQITPNYYYDKKSGKVFNGLNLKGLLTEKKANILQYFINVISEPN